MRRVAIPKSGGGERLLGIPTIRDRVVEAAAKLVLEPIFEADFEDNAYGYRPARGAVRVATIFDGPLSTVIDGRTRLSWKLTDVSGFRFPSRV